MAQQSETTNVARQSVWCVNFDNSSGTRPTLLRMLPCVHNHGDRTPIIRNGNATFQLYHQFRRVANFKQQRHSSFRIFLLPLTASKDAPLHIFQIYRFSMLVPSTRTLEQNLLCCFSMSEYELHLVRGDEKFYFLLLSHCAFFHWRLVFPLSEPCPNLFVACATTSCSGCRRADK